MKKFFSLFAAVLFAGSMMAAEELKATLDFSSNEAWQFPNDAKATAAASFSDGTYTITLEGTSGNGYRWYSNGTYLLLGKQGATMTLPAFEWKTTKILVYGTSGASEAVKQNIFVGEDAVSAETTGAKNVTNEYVIAEDYQEAGNVYVIKVTSAHNTQFSKIEIYGEGEGGDPTPVVEYYVVGSMNNWELSADYKLAANPGQAGEFMKRFTFAANDELKVRKAIDGELDAWYPEGVGNNWVITEDGQYDVYFRPEGNTEWANGFFFVAPYVIPQYDVAEAIAAGLAENAEVEVRGVVSKIEIKGKNFASFGSACIYVNDATGAEGQFEFYNCYAVGSAKFTTTDPAYDATSTAWAQLTEVATADGYAIHVGDTVIARGNYTYYSQTSMHELKQGCFIIYAKEPDAEFPTAIDNTNIDAKAVKFFENGQLIIIKNGVRYNAQGAVVR